MILEISKPNISLRDHLRSRGMDLERYSVILDDVNDIATFLIWDLSGRLVGFQQYNPNGSKQIRNDEKHRDQLKYFTFSGDEGDGSRAGKKKLTAWGFETLRSEHRFLFITEGVFDAVKIHNAGYPALAVISNDPQHLRSLFRALGVIVIAICDRDPAGAKLGNSAHLSFSVPEPYHDLGDMPQVEVESWLKTLSIIQ